MSDVSVNPVVSSIRTRTADADWWKGAVIYQIYPRSFQDSNGDGVGDLPGITRRLPYLADLGVDAVWLSPFFTSPMKDFGYDVSNYCDVDPIFGTLRDFEALTAEAHARGIKVIIDQVISHTSDLHPWFVKSRRNKTNAKADWYVWADAAPDGTAPNNWLSIFGGPAWEWDSRRCQYYMHNFLTSQPDLNFHNEEVQAAVLDVLKFWLELGVDGFRLDTVNYYFHDKLLRSNPPAPNGPTGNDAPAVNPYGRQDHIHDKNQPENLEFLRKLRAVLTSIPAPPAWARWVTARARCRSWRTTPPAATSCTCATPSTCSAKATVRTSSATPSASSRATRARAGRAGPSPTTTCRAGRPVHAQGGRSRPPAQARVGAAPLLPRSVCLYEGEELGLTEASLSFEDLVDPTASASGRSSRAATAAARTPMPWEAEAPQAGFTTGKPWLPVPAEHAAAAVDRQAGVAGSTLEHYRRFPRLPAGARGAAARLDRVPADHRRRARLPAQARGRDAALRLQLRPRTRACRPAQGRERDRGPGRSRLLRPDRGRRRRPRGGRRLFRDDRISNGPPEPRAATKKSGRFQEASAMSSVKLTEVVKSYGTVKVLHGINLDIRKGEFVVFVGPSVAASPRFSG